MMRMSGLQNIEFAIAADLLEVIAAKYGAPSIPSSQSASAIAEALVTAKLAQASASTLHRDSRSSSAVNNGRALCFA